MWVAHQNLTVTRMVAMSTEYPSMGEQGKNFLKGTLAILRSITKGEQVLSSKEVQEQRMEICNSCEYKDGARCTQCGCVLEWKVPFAVGECPLGKWIIDSDAIEKAILENIPEEW